jgi:hypothetical protein
MNKPQGTMYAPGNFGGTLAQMKEWQRSQNCRPGTLPVMCSSPATSSRSMRILQLWAKEEPEVRCGPLHSRR